MPYKDPAKHRDYCREYMRKRAAAKKAAQPGSAAETAKAAREDAELVAARARLFRT
jgi:hypothetical protein